MEYPKSRGQFVGMGSLGAHQTGCLGFRVPVHPLRKAVLWPVWCRIPNLSGGSHGRLQDRKGNRPLQEVPGRPKNVPAKLRPGTSGSMTSWLTLMVVTFFKLELSLLIRTQEVILFEDVPAPSTPPRSTLFKRHLQDSSCRCFFILGYLYHRCTTK